MKKFADEDISSPFDFYNELVSDPEYLDKKMRRLNDIEMVQLYRTLVRRVEQLKALPEIDETLIGYYWLATSKLETTDAVQRYLKGEITQADIDAYEEQKEKEVQAIVANLQAKRYRKEHPVLAYFQDKKAGRRK